MINKSLKKNAYISIFLFFCTMLPIGVYSTKLGEQTLFGGELWVGFSTMSFFLWRYFFSPLSSEKYTRKIIQKFQIKFFKLLFETDEIKFRGFLGFFVFFQAFIIGKLLFYNLPMIGDDIAQYTHAKLIAKGLFSIPNHPMPDFFPMIHVINNGARWYSMYQLGHLLPLAVGHFFGVPYLADPIMCGVSAVFLYLIAYDNYGKKIARVVGLLTILCVEWWYMGSDYMNHNSSMLGCMIFVWAWMRFLQNFKKKYSFIAGAAIGFALITRPITAIGFALPFALYGLYKLWKKPLRNWLAVLPAIIAFAMFMVWQFYFNLKTTGDYLVFGPEILYGDSIKYGFGHLMKVSIFGDFYFNTTHTLWRGIGHLSNNLVGLNLYLFNWPIPSLIFVFISLICFRIDVFSRLMLLSWVSLAAIYIPYFYSDWTFGPRYMYEIIGFLIILTAIGITRFPAILRVYGVREKYSQIVEKLHFFLFLLSLSAIIMFSLQIPRMSSGFEYPKGDVLQINASFPDNSLVFLNKNYWFFAMYQPPLDLNRIIYAKDLGDKNQKLIDYYPNRTVFLETADGVFTKIKDAKNKDMEK